MGDSDKKGDRSIPAWQQHTQSPDSAEAMLEQARRFLRDDEVRRATREKKVEFLQSKGLDASQIEILLEEEARKNKEAPPADPPEDQGASSALDTPTPSQGRELELKPEPEPESEWHEQQQQQQQEAEAKTDHPPIVTYPEFLARPTRPPPLMTPTGFLNTVCAFAGLSTLVYGASRHLLEPMVGSLMDARAELHESAAGGLARVVARLETAVSEVPPTALSSTLGRADADNNSSNNDDDDDDGDNAASSCGDPTEVFHRDVGVQTSSPPRSPTPSSSASDGVDAPHHNNHQAAAPSERQARRVSALAASLRAVGLGLASEAEGCADVARAVRAFRDELDRLSYGAVLVDRGANTNYGSGITAGDEADDEVKRVKESIRRVKGVLLSARSFPAATR